MPTRLLFALELLQAEFPQGSRISFQWETFRDQTVRQVLVTMTPIVPL